MRRLQLDRLLLGCLLRNLQPSLNTDGLLFGTFARIERGSFCLGVLRGRHAPILNRLFLSNRRWLFRA